MPLVLCVKLIEVMVIGPKNRHHILLVSNMKLVGGRGGHLNRKIMANVILMCKSTKWVSLMKLNGIL